MYVYKVHSMILLFTDSLVRSNDLAQFNPHLNVCYELRTGDLNKTRPRTQCFYFRHFKLKPVAVIQQKHSGARLLLF